MAYCLASLVLPWCVYKFWYFTLSSWNCVASASFLISLLSNISGHSQYSEKRRLASYCQRLRTFFFFFPPLLISCHSHSALWDFKDSLDFSYCSVSLLGCFLQIWPLPPLLSSVSLILQHHPLIMPNVSAHHLHIFPSLYLVSQWQWVCALQTPCHITVPFLTPTSVQVVLFFLELIGWWSRKNMCPPNMILPHH